MNAEEADLIDDELAWAARICAVVHAAVLVVDSAAVVVACSSQAAAIFGVDVARMIGCDLIAVTHPDDRSAAEAIHRRVFERLEPVTVHQRIIGHAGAAFHLTADICPLPGATARSCGAVVTLQRAEPINATASGLLSARDLQHDVLAVMPMPVLVAQYGVVVFANPAAYPLFGVFDLATLQERVRTRAHVPPLEAARIVERAARRALGEVLPTHVEYHIVRPDATTRVVEWSTIPMVYGGEPADLYALNDVTDVAEARDSLAALEAHQRDIVSALAEGVIVVDAGGICTDANQAAADLLRLEAAELLIGASAGTMPLVDHITHESVPRDAHPVWRALGGHAVASEVFGVRFGRKVRTMLVSARPFDSVDWDRPQAAVITFTDITAEHRLRADLAMSERRFRELAERSADVVVAVTLDPLQIDYISPAVTDLTGHRPDDLIGGPEAFLRVVHPDDQLELIDGLTTGRMNGIFPFRVITRTGMVRHVEARSTFRHDTDHRLVGVDSTIRDITDMVVATQHLDVLAHRDPLTGLPNRRALSLALEARRVREPLTVLFCDLDGFKAINDTYGHDAGDRLLVEIARRLSAAVRTTDVVARFAGDEFVLLVDPTYATSTVIRIQQAMSEPIAVSPDNAAHVGISVGTATLQPDDDLDTLMHRADADMYDTKRNKRATSRDDTSRDDTPRDDTSRDDTPAHSH